jgi:hypothetical protein
MHTVKLNTAQTTVKQIQERKAQMIGFELTPRGGVVRMTALALRLDTDEVYRALCQMREAGQLRECGQWGGRTLWAVA